MIGQSRDPDRQVLVLVTYALGGMLLHLAARTTPPPLEIYAEGILTDSILLDEYLKTVSVPPDAL